ncbi:MAG TPA: NAD(P)/FAD-dependent oxidoreductase [Chitinophagaceae bacterium]|nr:NAD(P)/FAD-dependent oxidoreductase [Chitinophagaceae bacterium]
MNENPTSLNVSKKPTINIIGAGISGLCAGCYLQMNGFETQIFEKHSIPGGLCTSWDKGEFTIDGCVHWILGSDKGSGFYHMWSELLNLEPIEFHHHEIRLHIELNKNSDKYGNKVFTMYNDLDRLREYMIDLSPEDEKVINSFIQDIRVLQNYDLPPVMDKLPLIPSIVRGIKMSRYLKFLFILNKQRKVSNYDLARKFKSPFLREAFELIYDGNEVKMLVFNFPQAVFDKKSAGYPIGGSLAWAKKIEEKYISLGGKIHYKTPVRKIVTENDKAVGLVVRNDIFHASDAVLSSADWYKTMFEYLEGNYVTDKMRKLSEGKVIDVYYSVLLVSFGLKKTYKEYPHFLRFPTTIKLESPCGTSWERLEVHFYNYDPTLAPEGKTVMACSFYTTNGKFWIDLRKNNRPQYREVKTKFVNDLIALLELKFPGIKDDIEVSDFATPATILRYTNSWQGSAQGWLPGENIVASPPVKFTLPKLKSFFYASHWGRPGGGLPVAINQGRDVAKIICKAFKKEFKTTKAK